MSGPISACLLETAQGLILIDAGINSALINDPELGYQHFTAKGWHPANDPPDNFFQRFRFFRSPARGPPGRKKTICVNYNNNVYY